VVCHAEVTAAQTTERALARKLLRKAMANIRRNSKRPAKNTVMSNFGISCSASGLDNNPDFSLFSERHLLPQRLSKSNSKEEKFSQAEFLFVLSFFLAMNNF